MTKKCSDTRETCRWNWHVGAKIGDIFVCHRHVANMSPTFPAKVTTNTKAETAMVEMVDGGEQLLSSIVDDNNNNHNHKKGALIDRNGRGG
jgi:hypothetical protein